MIGKLHVNYPNFGEVYVIEDFSMLLTCTHKHIHVYTQYHTQYLKTYPGENHIENSPLVLQHLLFRVGGVIRSDHSGSQLDAALVCLSLNTWPKLHIHIYILFVVLPQLCE